MRLSILTPSFNSVRTLADNLESVRGQEGGEVEHIVIDGGSGDGTVDLLRGHGACPPERQRPSETRRREAQGDCPRKEGPPVGRTQITQIGADFADYSFRYVSEPDRGMYDALNKGVAIATGDVIGQLNADDFYAHPGVLARVARAFEETGADVVYGDLVYVSGDPIDGIGSEEAQEDFPRKEAFPAGGTWITQITADSTDCGTTEQRIDSPPNAPKAPERLDGRERGEAQGAGLTDGVPPTGGTRITQITADSTDYGTTEQRTDSPPKAPKRLDGTGRGAARGEGGTEGAGTGPAPRGYRIVRYWRSGPYDPKLFYRGWMPPHPAFFARREAYARLGGYRLDLGTAADYELMLRFLLKGGLRVAYVPEVLVCMRVGGASNRSLRARWRAHRMDRRAWKVNGLKPRPWTLLLKPLRKLPQWWRRPR